MRTSQVCKVKVAEGIYAVEPTLPGPARNRFRRWKRKREAVDYLGGKCVRCKEEVHLAAFTFHHRDPALKTQATKGRHRSIFGASAGLHRELSELDKLELDTCDLLCSNCHAVVDFSKEGNIEFTIKRGNG